MSGRYAPIGDYGIIGDLNTIALVGMDGSIDFLCLPDFDSPSVFAALVDAERGGRFQIAPLLAGAARKQLYLPDTNVLLTRFLDSGGVAELSDFMPVADARDRPIPWCDGRRLYGAKCAFRCAVTPASIIRVPPTRPSAAATGRCCSQGSLATAIWSCVCGRRFRCASRTASRWLTSH